MWLFYQIETKWSVDNINKIVHVKPFFLWVWNSSLQLYFFRNKTRIKWFKFYYKIFSWQCFGLFSPTCLSRRINVISDVSDRLLKHRRSRFFQKQIEVLLCSWEVLASWGGQSVETSESQETHCQPVTVFAHEHTHSSHFLHWLLLLWE